MPLLVFRHVNTHHAVLVIEQEFCQGFCQFSLPYPRRPQEDERTDRTFGVLQPGTVPADCIGNCPDHQMRGVECKHIIAVKLSFAIRKQVETVKRIPPINATAGLCAYCGSSLIIKDGVRHNDYGDIQVYYCKECGQHFVLNVGFEGMKSTPQDITAAMQLYFSGLSFRNVTKALKLRGVKVSHVAVYKWINK